MTLPVVAPDGLEDREDSTIVRPAYSGSARVDDGPGVAAAGGFDVRAYVLYVVIPREPGPLR